MSKPVYYRLPTGQWRVTDARDDWRDDGTTYPESNLGDQYFDKRRGRPGGVSRAALSIAT